MKEKDLPFNIRLVDVESPCAGWVEGFVKYSWNKICYEGQLIRAAAVVCRELGCGSAVGVSKVRLVNGSNHCTGRLEVYYEDSWGTVCDDDWDARDAAVVCKQLRCGPAMETTQKNPFGPGSGPVWLKRVLCGGWESHLSQCGSWVSPKFACTHMHDVAVTCLGADIGISNMSLVNGRSRCAGRLEIFSNDTWGKAQSNLHDLALWGLPDAAVICKVLECGPVLEVNLKQGASEDVHHRRAKSVGYGECQWRSGYRIDRFIGDSARTQYSPWGVFCNGTESSISECGSKKMNLQLYQHIIVQCSDSGTRMHKCSVPLESNSCR
ncbi:scavenger receptor cysteine-rich type 1 protein M130-like [Microcaecilia unicolor]|uniref:Scavenger receptor cysteine-rich type 1 protein M130-like n=1 Tax=Microcaecilia unicolor TaxID=1415580 RepID=A0A6P7X2S1_9AMPH|nr:scavenger receptor cysteine-rich type 1 protein M130-like [Microcaecilia unicolor]